MSDKRKEQRFDELMENLSNREWQSREELLEVETMGSTHIENIILRIEEGELTLLGLEEEYLEMFREELSDREEQLNFDE